MQTGAVGIIGAIGLIASVGCADMHGAGGASTKAMEKPGPAQGYTVHVVAPHKFEDGTVHGPYHHYCKPISQDVIQCLLFESTDPNALLTDIEYFVSKSISRSQVPLDTWNKYYHDHEAEIATGRVQVLDMPEAQAKEIAAAAAKTDGIIFHLWPSGAKAPNGEVGHPQAVGHKPRTE
ncbi:hypothetical protein W02_20880 [Nitrospira sp. KM1]|uniref:DUF1264 domain-containing protein n=1 Tax=Nitrospira sp. KM1 TaxID=1936990 RepID=UPI0013A774EF|nr:DUF1264 domain-containing protein [Nitrospira sp. KM1]BCA54948.1 hypothetical protein W02_20880 [Nitrospira sp. KM1]